MFCCLRRPVLVNSWAGIQPDRECNARPLRLALTSPSSRLVFRLMLPEEPPSAPPKNIVASGRTNQSIMVQWQPPPETEHNGVLRGYILRQVARLARGAVAVEAASAAPRVRTRMCVGAQWGASGEWRGVRQAAEDGTRSRQSRCPHVQLDCVHTGHGVGATFWEKRGGGSIGWGHSSS